MLDKIVKGQTIKPPRVVIHGQQKIGKTTFAAGAPRPIFIPTEDGADDIGVDRFPLCTTAPEVHEALDALIAGGHDYETVVIDSGDWLERILQKKVAADAGVRTVDEIPYGKGHPLVVAEMKRVLDKLDVLRSDGLASVIITHTETRRYDSPEVEPYDRFTLKLHKSVAALVTEWCDVVGFATLETYTKSSDVGFNKVVHRGASTGRRVLKLEGAPAYVAGNRYGMPAQVDLRWDAFVEAFGRAKILKKESA